MSAKRAAIFEPSASFGAAVQDDRVLAEAVAADRPTIRFSVRWWHLGSRRIEAVGLDLV